MHLRFVIFGLCYFPLFVLGAAHATDVGSEQVPLIVPAGVPLRLYLTHRVPKRADAPVEAKLLNPVYAFDRQVIPTGAVVLGHVVEVKPVSKAQRTRAILGGDFTPLHIALIEFTTVVMPEGHRLALKTAESLGLDSIVSLQPPKKQSAAQQNSGIASTAKQQAHDAIQAKIDQVKGIPSLVRGPDKKDKVEDYLMSKLPYHPQYIRTGTRFDAELTEPLSFGSERLPGGSLAQVGTQPPPGSVAEARLITPLDSRSAKQGEMVKAVLAQPVYSADRKLILPEGTLVEGTVVAARQARWFHRGGQLRFTFKEIELPEEVVHLTETTTTPASLGPSKPPQDRLKFRTEANLHAAEGATQTPLKVDGEGGVEAKESKTRFLAAAAAVMVANRAGDNDPIRNQSHQIVGQSQNVGGRTIGGGFGFGLLGVGIAQSSRWVGAAFGYYGMAWSLFSTLIARGSEVQFGKDAMVDIRFDTRSK